jgi:hypothetical protein
MSQMQEVVAMRKRKAVAAIGMSALGVAGMGVIGSGVAAAVPHSGASGAPDSSPAWRSTPTFPGANWQGGGYVPATRGVGGAPVPAGSPATGRAGPGSWTGSPPAASSGTPSRYVIRARAEHPLLLGRHTTFAIGPYDAVAGTFKSQAAARALVTKLGDGGFGGFTVNSLTMWSGTRFEVEHSFPTFKAAIAEVRALDHAGFRAFVQHS